jgi:peptide/nickel transport system ATP-binding protein
MDQWIKRDYHSLAPRIGVIYQNPAEAVSHRLSVFDIVAEPLRIQNRRLPGAELRSRSWPPWTTSGCPPPRNS